jgi:hypothetical protein
MCIAIRRFPEHDLTVAELRGAVTGPELLDFMDRLQIAERTRRWLTYVAPDADLSQLDLMSLARLKGVVGRKLVEADHELTFVSAFVCASRCSEPVIRLWADYLGRDPEHPTKPQIFSSLQAAFDHLDLSPEARDAVSRRLQPPRPVEAPPRGQEKPTTAWGT